MLGAVLLASLPELLRPLKDARLIINGVVLVFASIYLPQGIAGALRSLKQVTLSRYAALRGGR
jgi:branched-chain amino acid transport system permease protein